MHFHDFSMGGAKFQENDTTPTITDVIQKAVEQYTSIKPPAVEGK